MPTLPETPVHDPVIPESSTDPYTGCGEAPPSERLQSLADGLAIVVDGLHGPTVPVRVARHVTPLLDSIVVALTDLASELAGAELWRDITPAAIVNGHEPRNYRAEYRARVERMARRL